MNTSLALAIILGQPGQSMKIPVYSADQRTPVMIGSISSLLPDGFTEGKYGSGDISSEDGKITVTLLKSKAPMPSLLRNPKFTNLKDFTTIRMTNWIGFRNSRPDGEDYKLDWHNYRINFSLMATSKDKVMKLRSALHQVIDGLIIKQ